MESIWIILIVFGRVIIIKFGISYHGLNKSHQEAVIRERTVSIIYSLSLYSF